MEIVEVPSSLNGCIKDCDDTGSDPASYEKSLLDEMDSYMEDLESRLMVSRMVSDSVIRGMVNAVQDEAAERIASKDAQVAALNERLQHNESSAGGLKLEPSKRGTGAFQYSLDARQELDLIKRLEILRIAADERFQRLFERAAEDAANEEQWQEGIRGQISGFVVQRSIRGLQDEFETRTSEQWSLMDAVGKNWRKGADEIASIRRELEVIYKSLSNADSGQFLSHRSVETSRNVTERSEDLGERIPTDAPQLKCMSKEGLIAFFKTEMNKMKRQHEIALQEKTEELFSLKRGILKEKGSGPLHSSKEKDLDIIKKKISDLILKLDGIVLENKELLAVFDDQDTSHSLRERIDTFLLVLSENQWLQGLLIDEKKEARCSVSQDSSGLTSAEEVEFVSQALSDINSAEEVERLQMAIADLKMEASIKEEIHKSVLEDLFNEIEADKESLETVAKIIDDNYSIIYRGVASDALSDINPVIAEVYEQKDFINKELLRTKEALVVECDKSERLKQEIEALSAMVKEKEKLALDAGTELLNKKKQLDLVCCELNTYRDQFSKQEMFIANSKSELDMLSSKLHESLQQIQQRNVSIRDLNQKLMMTSDALAKMEMQNNILCRDIQEKDKQLLSAFANAQEQKKQLESILASMEEISKTISDFGCRLTQQFGMYEARLHQLSHQFNHIKEQGNSLRRKVSWYKERFEARCEDLQKAEIEVDLLGDEVDVLLGLLEKIYMALDHYSPVLQHYPGVVEILKMMRRKMDGQTIEPR